jgi:hAT family C-terminal dimerisation region
MADEVSIYLSAKVPDITDPLEYWQNKQQTFPRLTQLVPKCLCCSASSAISESSFSTMTSIIVTKGPDWYLVM